MNIIIKFPHKPVRDSELPHVPKDDMDAMRRIHKACEELQAFDGCHYEINRIQIRNGHRIVSGVQTAEYPEQKAACLAQKEKRKKADNFSGMVQREGDNFKAVDPDLDEALQKMLEEKIWVRPKPDGAA
jgi:hypothetical protein